MTDSGGSIEGGASGVNSATEQSGQIALVVSGVDLPDATTPSDLDSHSEARLIDVRDIVSIGQSVGELIVDHGDGRVDRHSPDKTDPEVEFFRRELYPMTQRAIVKAIPQLVRVRVVSVTEGDMMHHECVSSPTASFAVSDYVEFKITRPPLKGRWWEKKNWRNAPRNPKSKRIRKKWGLL